MTREKILAMKPEELSQKVAEEIMGECYHQHWDGNKDLIDCLKCGESRFYHQKSQEYSTDISAAWQVVEKLCQKGFCARLQAIPDDDHKVAYYCSFYPSQIGGAKNMTLSLGTSMPEAICKAALLAEQGYGG